METIIFDGKAFSKQIDEQTQKLTDRFQSIQGRKPRLLIVDPANTEESMIYARSKSKKGVKLGIETIILSLGGPSGDYEPLLELEKYILKDEPDGIFVERPLPSWLNQDSLENTIPQYLDIEGTSSCMQGKNLNGNPHVIPATAEAVLRIIEYLGGRYGNDVCIVSRTNTIGRPLAMALLNRNYTVTVCHSKTQNISKFTSSAGIVVSATGKPLWLGSEQIREGAAVIDVGIVQVGDKIVGDANREQLMGKAAFLTPVPGGVGPVTTSIIMENLIRLCLDRIEDRFQT